MPSPLVVYLVWTRDHAHAWAGERVPYTDPITYRDWPLLVRDLKAALAHGRQVRIARATLARSVWDAYPAPTAEQVRRLRGTKERVRDRTNEDH